MWWCKGKEHLQRQLYQKKFFVFLFQQLPNQLGWSWLKFSYVPLFSGGHFSDASQAVKQYTFTCRSRIPLVKNSYGFTDGSSKIKFNNVTDPAPGSSFQRIFPWDSHVNELLTKNKMEFICLGKQIYNFCAKSNDFIKRYKWKIEYEKMKLE